MKVGDPHSSGHRHGEAELKKPEAAAGLPGQPVCLCWGLSPLLIYLRLRRGEDPGASTAGGMQSQPARLTRVQPPTDKDLVLDRSGGSAEEMLCGAKLRRAERLEGPMSTAAF